MDSSIPPPHDLQQYPHRPGVYQMYAADNTILYIGKARDLRRRLGQYFQRDLPLKTRLCMQEVRRIEYTITPSEWEALLLEARLIKTYQPKYNILLKDDKSYPYLYINSEHPFPQLALYRGNRDAPGQYFGPYPHAQAVRDALDNLQKIFRLRSCTDHTMASRDRPCLQYEMHRCTAPCVGYVSPEAYREQVDQAIRFLKGKDGKIRKTWEDKMWDAVATEDFEQAAQWRDMIHTLDQLQSRQAVVHGHRDVDVFAYAAAETCPDLAVLSRLVIRGGWILGHRSYVIDPSALWEPLGEPAGSQDPASVPENPVGLSGTAAVADPVVGWIIQCLMPEAAWPELVLVATNGGASGTWPDGRKVRIRRIRGDLERRLYTMAAENAQDRVARLVAKRARYLQAAQALQQDLGLAQLANRWLCWDVSHFQGEATYVSQVVCDSTGPVRADYRRYRVKPDQPGDDYQALALALAQYAEAVRAGRKSWPDGIVVDGGLGQYRVCAELLAAQGMGSLPVLAIAKGPARKSGEETVYYARPGQPVAPITLSPAAFLWIQSIRDEAHRFAITGHRQARDKARVAGEWQAAIPGLGPVKRKRLLEAFGGLVGIQSATPAQLHQVQGIDRRLADAIYQYFHPEGSV